MQKTRKSLLVVVWTVLGLLALVIFEGRADGSVGIGLFVVGLAVALTFGINWIFAESESDE